MILCVAIGNTRIQCAVGVGIGYKQFAIDTKDIICETCFTAFIQENIGAELNVLVGCIVACVVPEKKQIVVDAIKKNNANIPIKFIDKERYGIDFSRYDGNLGEDRVVCCVEAVARYKKPVVIIDFGTATTVNVIDENNVFLGGAILAGVQMGVNALSKATAQLPMIDDFVPVCAIGGGTRECIASGAVMGAAFAAEGYIKHITEALKARPVVVITGGNASRVVPHCGFEFVYEPSLLMEGLFFIYEN